MVPFTSYGKSHQRKAATWKTMHTEQSRTQWHVSHPRTTGFLTGPPVKAPDKETTNNSCELSLKKLASHNMGIRYVDPSSDNDESGKVVNLDGTRLKIDISFSPKMTGVNNPPKKTHPEHPLFLRMFKNQSFVWWSYNIPRQETTVDTWQMVGLKTQYITIMRRHNN